MHIKCKHATACRSWWLCCFNTNSNFDQKYHISSEFSPRRHSGYFSCSGTSICAISLLNSEDGYILVSKDFCYLVAIDVNASTNLSNYIIFSGFHIEQKILQGRAGQLFVIVTFTIQFTRSWWKNYLPVAAGHISGR